MSKLLKLKEWLTLPDAAKCLGSSLGEDVAVEDLLRLALDGHLVLSVNLVNHASARVGKYVEFADTNWIFCPPLFDRKPINQIEEEDLSRYPKSLQDAILATPKNLWATCDAMMMSLDAGEGRFINLSNEVETVSGIWDLPMIGGEMLDVEHFYQSKSGGPAVTLQSLEGTFLSRASGEVCQLQESYEHNPYMPGTSASLQRIKDEISDGGISELAGRRLLEEHSKDREKYLRGKKDRPHAHNFHPAGGLPKDAVYVIRTQSLRELERTIAGVDQAEEKPLDQRERATYERIIYVLAKEAGYQLEHFTADEVALQQHAASIGAKVPTGKGPIADRLKAAAKRYEQDRAY